MSFIVRRHLMFVFEEDELSEIADMRRRWDPIMARGVPPHVTLAYPEEFDDQELLLERARVAGTAIGPFSLVCGEVVACDGGANGVFLAVEDASGSWNELRKSLLSTPFSRFDVLPHLTIVHPRTSDRGAAAWRDLRGWRPDIPVRASALAFTGTGVTPGFQLLERIPLSGSRRALCVGVLLVEGSSVLLSKRASGRSWYPGVWDVPGGHVEPGESLIAAAVREAREELGVVVVPSRLQYVATLVGEDYELVAFAAMTWSGKVVNAAPEEHEQVRWFTEEQTEGLEVADSRMSELVGMAVSVVS